MKISTSSLVQRPIAAMLAVLLAAPVAQAAPQQPASEPSQPAVTQQQPAPTPQPDVPQPSAPAPSSPDAPTPLLLDSPARSSSSQSDPQSGQNPVGTATAPMTKPTGIAASRPAGAAIAPAKQRRAKIIFIRVAIIVAAGAAIGAVAGLSRSSSARP